MFDKLIPPELIASLTEFTKAYLDMMERQTIALETIASEVTSINNHLRTPGMGAHR